VDVVTATTESTSASRRPWRRALDSERLKGGIFILLGLAMIGFFTSAVEPGQRATFGLSLGADQAIRVPDLVLPVGPTIYLLGLAVAFLGGWQIARSLGGARRRVRGSQWWGVAIVLFTFAFLTWAARGSSFNLTGMLRSSLQAATPIALSALSGVWCERSAVINIGIEGMLLTGAFVGVVVASATGSLWLGLMGAVLGGALLGAFLAVLSIKFKVDQIISGTAINIFAVGLTSYLGAAWLVENQALNASGRFGLFALPLLSDIPILGPIFFNVNALMYFMMILVGVTHVVLFYTRWGLRTRAVGEHPLAADTLGVNVFRTRYVNVIVGGMVAGLGGAYFTLGSVGRFDEVMTAGRGFIGLAAMIFGQWSPLGAFASSMIFGFFDSLQVKLALLNVPIPSHFLLMAPYVATIIAVTGVVGRTVAPAADGEPYEKQ
jgi:ABC-type uncharacterized transport system permease subunit